MPDMHNFGLEFENATVIFKISVLEFVLLHSLAQKYKSLNLRLKILFWVWNLKMSYLHQHPRICLITKFRKKTKITNLGTKNALCGYFWAIILKKLLLYLKSAPSNLSKLSF